MTNNITFQELQAFLMPTLAKEVVQFILEMLGAVGQSKTYSAVHMLPNQAVVTLMMLECGAQV